MKFQKYVYVVNGMKVTNDDWRVKIKDVFVVNLDSKVNMPAHATTVYVMNGMPRNDWPSSFDDVYIINGVSRTSDNWPTHYENVYVVNIDDLRKLPSLRKMFDPSLQSLKCNVCWTEFEESASPNRFYKCQHCGNVFHELQSLPRY